MDKNELAVIILIVHVFVTWLILQWLVVKPARELNQALERRGEKDV